MTTIAWDGETLAGDSMVTSHKIEGKTFKKIKRVNGYLLAGAGPYSTILQFFKDVKQLNLEPAINVTPFEEGVKLIVVKDNKLFVIDSNNGSLIPITGTYAFGSGGDFAKGAMDAGASAREAVKIAKNNDPLTGGRIYSLAF